MRRWSRDVRFAGPVVIDNGRGHVSKQGKRCAGAVYTAQCAKCHGADGKGIASLGEMPNFTDGAWQSSRTDKQISDGISNGAGVMPGFKESLSAAEISALVKHVRAFGPAKGKK